MTFRELEREGWLEFNAENDMDQNIEIKQLKKLVEVAFKYQSKIGVEINPNLAKRYELMIS